MWSRADQKPSAWEDDMKHEFIYKDIFHLICFVVVEASLLNVREGIAYNLKTVQTVRTEYNNIYIAGLHARPKKGKLIEIWCVIPNFCNHFAFAVLAHTVAMSTFQRAF